MAITFESAGVDPLYNTGVFRLPGVADGDETSLQPMQQLFADLMSNKDIVGGQVDAEFQALLGTPLSPDGVTDGVYVAATYDDGGTNTYTTDVAGLLLLSVDATGAARQINVVKGGNVSTKVGALAAMDATQLGALADALGGKYDAIFNSIKF